MSLVDFFLLAVLAAAPAQSALTVPHGFRILADMKQEVSSKKAKVGDSVNLVCMNAIEAQDGTVFIPLGAQLLGKVVAVQKYSKGHSARLSIRVQGAKWDGGEAKLDAYVVTIVSVAKVKYDDKGIPEAIGPARNSDPSDINSRADTQRNYDIHTATKTIKSRDASEGEKKLDAMPKSGSPPTSRKVIMTDVPDSWGLEKVDDPAIGSAITVDDGDVVLTQGSRLVLKTH
jgi:hypothetical protein